MTCPLCQQTDNTLFHIGEQREYWCCGTCDLIFVPPQFYLSADEEKARYLTHNNDPLDKPYQKFLIRILPPIAARVAADAAGLDFGCGPETDGTTALVRLFELAGYSMARYDPYFSPNTAVLTQYYDFITTTEAAEHFYQPFNELNRLFNRLKPNGVLAVMTRRHDSIDDFASWHYKNDPTHICFFSKASCRWIAAHWQADIEFIDNDIIVFQKQGTPT